VAVLAKGARRVGPARGPGQAGETLRPPAEPWLRSFVYAGRGVRRAWRCERNFRVQLAAGWAALAAGGLAGLDPTRLAILAGLVAMVLAAEILNAALEAAVDLVAPAPHPLAGAAKDLAAGAVLLAAAGAAAAAVALFWPVAALPAALWSGALRRPALAAVGVAGTAVLGILAAGRLPGRRPRR
jgi:diacylglycerol kinase